MRDHLSLRRCGQKEEDSDGHPKEEEEVTEPLMMKSTLHSRAATGARMLAVYLLGWVLLWLSWMVLYRIFAMNNSRARYMNFVLGSVVLSCACYTVWGLLVKHGPPPGPRECVRLMACTCRPVRRDGWREACVHFFLNFPLRHVIHYCLILLPSIALIAAFRRIDFTNENTFSNELHLWVAIVLWDAVVAYIMTAILIVQAVGILFPRPKSPTAVPAILRRWSCTPQRVAAVLVLCVTLLIAGNIVFLKTADDALEVARGTVLGEPGKDLCASAGMQLNPKKLKGGLVVHALLPRRMFNFHLGSEKCRPEGQVPLGLIDEEAEVLVVPTRCPASVGWRNMFAKPQTPRVFLAVPSNSVFNGEDMDSQFRGQNAQFHKILEAKFGNDTSVIVHRSPSGVIQSVEMKPESLTATDRMAVSHKEKRIRAGWSGASVFVIPLGRSMTYTVRCDGAGMEDYFIHPLTPTAPQSSDTTAATADSTTDEPPANVLAFFFDAVSRQEVVRSLPLFTQWLRDFKGYRSHRVLEARSHSTVGGSTMRNFATLLAGTSLLLQGLRESYFSPVDFSNRTVFSLAKKRYGSRMQTSFNAAFCQDIIQLVFGRREATAGFGDGAAGIDQFMLEPLCRLDYAAPELRFQSAYGIHKRCMGNMHVHEHQLGYTKALLRQRLREIKASMGAPGKERFFFDMSYFMDGHEATHGMLALMDEALVDFMEELRVDLRFFDNPRNTVVLFSDHGNHMGPYAAFFEGGRIEKTMPFLIFIIHPETFKRVDRRRGWAEGSSEVAMAQRVHNLTTQADLYMTLCDLVGVEPALDPRWARASSAPQSLFNPFTAIGHVWANVPPVWGTTPESTRWCTRMSRKINKKRK